MLVHVAMVDDVPQASRETSKGMPHYSWSFVQLGKLLHNKNVVENYFKILKKMLKELLRKTNLNIIFLLDVVIYCCMPQLDPQWEKWGC
jgi:hypothetical protein